MSRAPRAKKQSEIDDYIASWHATMQLLREGKSFSGRERNCVFLNNGRSNFANISFVSGIDFPDDGRAIASTDWDHDGDIDLWIQNRTGPRLRFLRNQNRDSTKPRNFVALRLRGVTCNRDAIGARVEIRLATNAGMQDANPESDATPKIVQTVYAGDGYLSQSSKWLHFGLGDLKSVSDSIAKHGLAISVSVRWPDGLREAFSDVQFGGRYELVQGQGIAKRVNIERTELNLAAEPQIAPVTNHNISTRFANPIPLPMFAVRESSDDRAPILSNDIVSNSLALAKGKPKLIVLWASWCPNCLVELRQLASQQDRIESASLDVLALNVDSLADDMDSNSARGSIEKNSAAVIKQLSFPFATGFATTEMLDKLQVVQRVALNRPLESAVPTMLLVNRHNELTAIYQGVHSIDEILLDANQSDRSIAQRRDLSIPFAGTWTTPPGILLMRPVADVFRAAGYRSDYERFLKIDRERLIRLQASATTEEEKRQLEVRFANDSLDLALSLLDSGRENESLDYFRAGLERMPQSATGHFHFARALRSQGRVQEAQTEFRKTLKLDAKHSRASFELGAIATEQNRLDDAAVHFRRAVEHQPKFATAWTNLGVVLARLKRTAESIAALRIATELDSESPQAHLALGGQLAALREFKEAAKHFRRVTELAPNVHQGFAGLGQALVKRRDDVRAVPVLQRAIELNPRDVGSQLQLAWLQATSPVAAARDGNSALRIASTLAKASQYRDPRVLDVLAAALAENEEYQQATKMARRALEKIPDSHPLRAVVQNRIEQYKNQRPFRNQPKPDAGSNK